MTAMDSVNLINAGKPQDMTDDEWFDVVTRNRAHILIMLSKDFWTTEDLRPLRKVVE